MCVSTRAGTESTSFLYSQASPLKTHLTPSSLYMMRQAVCLSQSVIKVEEMLHHRRARVTVMVSRVCLGVMT